MRWLLIKDLQILKRSPLLVALLVVYPIAIALMIGFALSSPPGKPKVALLDEVPTGHTRVSLGNQQINISKYANQLFQSIDAIKVSSRAEAIDKVRSGQAAAALIIPANIISQINSLITQGVGNPTVDLVLNTKDPLERQFADQAAHQAHGTSAAVRKFEELYQPELAAGPVVFTDYLQIASNHSR